VNIPPDAMLAITAAITITSAISVSHMIVDYPTRSDFNLAAFDPS
jgi:hypothetical protein